MNLRNTLHISPRFARSAAIAALGAMAATWTGCYVHAHYDANERLADAVEINGTKEALFLLDNGASANAFYFPEGHQPPVELLDEWPFVIGHEDKKVPVLMIACRRGNFPLVKALVSHGAKTDCQEETPTKIKTPLSETLLFNFHFAPQTILTQLQMAKFLIQHTPKSAQEPEADLEAYCIVLALSNDPNTKANQEIQKTGSEVIGMLFDRYPKDINPDNLLIDAASWKEPKVIRIALQHGAKPSKALCMAVEFGDLETTETLLRAMNINEINPHGREHANLKAALRHGLNKQPMVQLLKRFGFVPF